MKTVIAPALNEQDTEDMPPHLLDDIAFVWADHVREVLDVALEPVGGARRARSRARRPRVATSVRKAARQPGMLN